MPAEVALRGFHAARAYSADPEASSEPARGARVRAAPTAAGRRAATRRGGLYLYDEPPAERAIQGAGSVHHIAWASTIDEHEEWRERAISAGAQPTPVIDRFYFSSIYFREPSGVLFEIATLGPGFTVDEPLEHLGEKLSLPPDFEHLRRRGRTEPAAGRQPACRLSPARTAVEPSSGGTPGGRSSSGTTGAEGRAPSCSPSTASSPSSCSPPSARAGDAELLREAAARGAPGPAGPGPRHRRGAARRRPASSRLVAFGGGRVIDTAKAVASVTGAEVAAIPTTLSGAEMTGIHRIPAGAEDRVDGLVRPSLVIAEPEAMTGLPEPRLRASAMNALAHAADSLYTPLRQPGLADDRAARRRADRDRARPGARAAATARALALGAILSGYAIDSGPVRHPPRRSARPWSGSAAARTRRPTPGSCRGRWPSWRRARPDADRAAGGGDRHRPRPRSRSASSSSAATRPGSARSAPTASASSEALDAILARPELGFTPGPPSREELTALIERAW